MCSLLGNELDTILPGDDVVTAENDGHTAGMSIYHDLSCQLPSLAYRRPAVYRERVTVAD